MLLEHPADSDKIANYMKNAGCSNMTREELAEAAHTLDFAIRNHLEPKIDDFLDVQSCMSAYDYEGLNDIVEEIRSAARNVLSERIRRAAKAWTRFQIPVKTLQELSTLRTRKAQHKQNFMREFGDILPYIRNVETAVSHITQHELSDVSDWMVDKIKVSIAEKKPLDDDEILRGLEHDDDVAHCIAADCDDY